MSTDPPAEFGEAFLSWLREATEAAWQRVDEWTVEDYESHGYIGPRWRRGTRWTGGLDDATTAALERGYGLVFPPQYRLFLQILHSTTPWRTGADYSRGDRLALSESPGFYDWLYDETQIRQAMRAVEDRAPLAEAIASHHGGSRWLPGGPSPALIPVFGHRYVVADDSQWVLSIVGPTRSSTARTSVPICFASSATYSSEAGLVNRWEPRVTRHGRWTGDSELLAPQVAGPALVGVVTAAA